MTSYSTCPIAFLRKILNLLNEESVSGESSGRMKGLNLIPVQCDRVCMHGLKVNSPPEVISYQMQVSPLQNGNAVIR